MARHGPTITTDLYVYQTDQLRQEIEERARKEIGGAGQRFADWVSEQVRQAYIRGLGDGYAQGVANRNPGKKAEESKDG